MGLKRKMCTATAVCVYTPAVVFKGQNNRVLRSDKCCLLNGLDNILLDEKKQEEEKLEFNETKGDWKDSYRFGVYLEQDVCAHSFAVSDNGLLVLSFSIPAIQLNTSGRKEKYTWNWKQV